MRHNTFSRLLRATNASKLVLMFYYILNFNDSETIEEILFSQRSFLHGFYFHFQTVLWMSLSQTKQPRPPPLVLSSGWDRALPLQ